MATQKTNNSRSLKSYYRFFTILIIIVIVNLILTIQSPSKNLFALVNPNTIILNDINKSLSNDKINEANQKESEYLWAIRGQIGDLLAGHFTVLAFLGLLYSIFQMQESLRKQDDAFSVQKEEMKLQREEFKKTADTLAMQSKLYEKQNFENTFFQLLNIYKDMLDSIEFEAKDNKIFKGKKAFNELYSDYFNRFEDEIITYEKLMESYTSFTNTHHSDVDSYFRTLYRIIKFVSEYKDDYKQIDKQFYINLLRAQLSFAEHFFIFINGLSTQGEKFKILIEKYSFLEHLSSINWFETFDIEIIEKYDIKAFGEGSFSKKENQKKAFLGQREMKIK